MGLDATNTVFVVSDKVILKPSPSATETRNFACSKFKYDTFQKRIIKALISLRGCASWSVPCCSQTP